MEEGSEKSSNLLFSGDERKNVQGCDLEKFEDKTMTLWCPTLIEFLSLFWCSV
jgi:hypothetical protein